MNVQNGRLIWQQEYGLVRLNLHGCGLGDAKLAEMATRLPYIGESLTELDLRSVNANNACTWSNYGATWHTDPSSCMQCKRAGNSGCGDAEAIAAAATWIASAQPAGATMDRYIGLGVIQHAYAQVANCAG
jgi:hypothetical protein